MFILRNYQKEALENIFNVLENTNENPIVVLPTGSGKSIIQAFLVEEVQKNWPNRKIFLLTHVKELIEQNVKNLLTIKPFLDLGIYSAGIGKRESTNTIIFGSVQSCYKKAELFKEATLIIIDEAHLVPKFGDGMYKTLLSEIKKNNPSVRIVGFTATPFRLDSGLLIEGENKIFDTICYTAEIKKLIDENFLCNLKNAFGKEDEKIKTEGMQRLGRNGDYIQSQLEEKARDENVANAAVKKITEVCSSRNKSLIFCCGVEHAQMICDKLNAQNFKTKMVCGKTSKNEREEILNEFKQGEIKAITNVNVLTTGFDAPDIDTIVMLRPTLSPGLYCQMIGRGMRVHSSKMETLILDFANNILTHGPIDDIEIKTKRVNGKNETEIKKAPMKECPNCNAACFLAAIECLECGYIFPAKEKHKAELQAGEILKKHSGIYTVSAVYFERHKKAGKPDSVKMVLRCGSKYFYEYVCLEHDGWARQYAVKKLSLLGIERCQTVDEFFKEHEKNALVPEKIEIEKVNGYVKIKRMINLRRQNEN